MPTPVCGGSASPNCTGLWLPARHVQLMCCHLRPDAVVAGVVLPGPHSITLTTGRQTCAARGQLGANPCGCAMGVLPSQQAQQGSH